MTDQPPAFEPEICRCCDEPIREDEESDFCECCEQEVHRVCADWRGDNHLVCADCCDNGSFEECFPEEA